MTTPRTLTSRFQLDEHDAEAFDYPFEFVAEEPYRLDVMNLPQNTTEMTVGTFPKNIVRWIWSVPGVNDELPWDALFQLTDEDGQSRFAYFHAWCDSTGFDCQGGMEVTLATSVESLIHYALSDAAYERYVETTEDMLQVIV